MLSPYLLGLRGPGRYVPGAGEGDGGFQEPPSVTVIAGGDVTINGKVKPGAFGKFVYPLAIVAGGRKYTILYDPDFSGLAQQGKLAMVGFGLKSGNDFHIVGLRGNGSTGLTDYKVYGTNPNGWNKDTGHTVSAGSTPANGTQAGPNWIQIEFSTDGTTYTLRTSANGTTWTDEYTGSTPTPFTDADGVPTFGVALWFNNADAGPFSVVISQFADAAAATAWTPASDANLHIWHKGSSLTGSNGSSVSTWVDSSGHSYDSTGGNGVTLDTTGLNSINVVNSPGASSPGMNIANVLSGLTEAAIYAVVKATTDPPGVSSNSGGWSFTGSGDYTSVGNHYPFTDGVVYDGFGSTTRKTTGNPTVALTTWHIVSMHSKSASYEMWINGTLHYSTGINTVGWAGVGAARLFHGQATSYFDGKVAEVFLMSNFGDTTSRQKAEGYLAHRFAITSVLASGHPYKTTPP